MRELLLKKFITFCLTRRYRIRVEGLEHVKDEKGCLILPNHISLLDPVIVGRLLADPLKPRPVVTQLFFDISLFKPIFDRMRAISAPNFIVGKNREKIYQLEECLNEVSKTLDEGDNVIFYPEGRLKMQAETKIDGSSGLYTLLEMKKELQVILVRVTGLWGSTYSNSVHGKTPHYIEQGMKTIFQVFANLLFFMPKRDVKIVLEKKTLNLSFFPNKRALNQHLDEWYNAEKDPFYSPPYHFLFRNKPLSRVLSAPPVEVKNEKLLDEVVQAVSSVAGRQVKATEHLAYDVGMDSLDLTELFTLLQEKYELSDLFSTELATPRHIAAMIEGSWMAKRLHHEREKQKKKAETFFKKKKSCLDEVSGPLGQKQIGGKIACWKEIFAKEESIKIPLLIPGGIDAYAASVAILSLKKEPLFLKPEEAANYTRIYTTKQTIIRWHTPHLNHQRGSLIYLPEKGVLRELDSITLPNESEALEFLKAKGELIQPNFTKDPIFFTTVTHVALKEEIPVILPFEGVPNNSWSKRIYEV